MGNNSKAKFLELGHKEVSAKFSHLAKNTEEIKVWHKGESPLLCRVIDYLYEDKIRIQLMKDSLDESWIDTEVLLAFDFNNVHYFASAKVVAEKKNDGYWLIIGDQIYKTEKRENERLLAYPHSQFYAYFRISSEGKNGASNVISLNRHKEPNTKAFKEFNRLRSEEILDLSRGSLEEKDELAGFRIMDISGNGLSFLSNQKEKEFFEYYQKNPTLKLDFIVLIDGTNYSIEEGGVVYIVDYVNPRADKVLTYKVGFTFPPHHDLAARVERLLKTSNSIGENEKDFEDLVD